MIGERALTVVLVVCCLFALGASATTLESAVDTPPDDVIDFERGALPLPSDEVQHLKRQIQSGSNEQRERSNDADAEGGSQDRADDDPSDGSATGESGDPSDGPMGASSGDGRLPAPSPGEDSLVDSLVGLLGDLLELLVGLLPAVFLAGLVVAGVHFRDRLRASLSGVGDRFGSEDGPASGPDVRPEPSPSNDVERAWFEMVRRVGLADETARTPRECAAEAKDAGVDPGVVDALTETFEQVRYGGAPVTEQRRTRAQQHVQQVRAQVGGGGERQ